MEIEYQDKNTITWCLEREGPLICLKATIYKKELESIEIKSEDFSLEFEYNEAKAFISILSQMTLAALAGLEIDNILIELDASEPPVMDGSAKVYLDTLLNP